MIDANPTLQPKYKKWLGELLDYPFSERATFLASIEECGKIKGVCGFDNFTGDNIELYMGGESPGWANKTLIKGVFHYVFKQLKCARCTALVEHDNEVALKIDKKLGFIDEGRIRKAKDGKDIIVLGMLKDECRWL